MKTKPEAQQLAGAIGEVGKRVGVEVSHLLTPMDEPLGRTVGHALEVAEAVQTLQGRGPDDLVQLVLDLGEKVSSASRPQLAQWLNDGAAWRKFAALVYAQDGDASALEKMRELHQAAVVRPFPAPQAGRLGRMDAEIIGRTLLLLGGGRQRADDAIDFSVGFSQIKKIGERVERGEPLLFIHARSEADAEVAATSLVPAIEIA
jgi:thymidine phosphorylase